MKPSRILACLALLGLLGSYLLSGCTVLDAIQSGLAEPTPTALPDENDPAVPIPETGAGQPPAPGTPTPEADHALTTWLVADISGSTLLQEQIVRFAATEVEFSLEIEQKIAAGPGGIQSYLQSAKTVAPSVLPDLALVPAYLLPDLVKSGLVYSFDGLMPEEDIDDLFPAASAVARVDGELYGYPQALAGLTHIAYNPGAITTTIPAQWSGFVNSPLRFAFPTGGNEGIQLLLQLYLAQGGSLVDENGKVRLEQPPLEAALGLLLTALNNGVLLPASDSLVTQGDTWALLQSGGASAILTTSQMYRQQASQGQVAGVAPLPGPNGPLVPLVAGWVCIVTTGDPRKQQMAADLIIWLANDGNMGNWSLRSSVLPSRRTAFLQWPENSYTTFLARELERATIMPPAAAGPINDALNGALRALFAPGVTPAVIPEIAEAAVGAIP